MELILPLVGLSFGLVFWTVVLVADKIVRTLKAEG